MSWMNNLFTLIPMEQNWVQEEHSARDLLQLMMSETLGKPALQTPNIAQWSWLHNGTWDRKSSCTHVNHRVSRALTFVWQSLVDWIESGGNNNLPDWTDIWNHDIEQAVLWNLVELHLVQYILGWLIPCLWIILLVDGQSKNKRTVMCHPGIDHPAWELCMSFHHNP